MNEAKDIRHIILTMIEC